MPQIDLDQVQGRDQTARELLAGPVPITALAALVESQADVGGLLAELVPGREVIAKARALLAEVSQEWAEPIALAAALDAYDAAVAS